MSSDALIHYRHKVECWESLAVEAGQVLRKGQRIAIHGTLHTDEWTDRNTGEPRKSHKIRADQIAICPIVVSLRKTQKDQQVLEWYLNCDASGARASNYAVSGCELV